MLHDLSRQLRRMMKESTRPNLGRRTSSTSLLEGNVIRLKGAIGVPAAGTGGSWRNRLLVEQGARMHVTCIERSDGCAIAMLDHRGVVCAWHDLLPGAAAFDFRIIGAHMSQFYLPQDITLLRPDRDLLAACLHGSTTQCGWRRRPGGSIFWAATVIQPIYLDNGELNGYSYVTRFAQDPRGRAPSEVRDVPRRYSTFQGAIAAA
ncbi:hypothetical protein [Peristeroidobacter soli]|uniref:hypothetical protein n=1 Tax=Peristeroidobacter soli TaxID=2497877 RepID=UPI00101D8F70|nr:hypothetical protein [Peristeroidobacter soli]